MSTTLNLFDLTFILLTILFVVIGFFRGFVKEIFSLAIWITSIVLAYIVSPFAVKYLPSLNATIVDVLAKALVFVTAFIILVIATANLRDKLRENFPGSIDRSLGIFYGLLKSLLIFGMIYSIANNSTALFTIISNKTGKEAEKLPAFLTEAKCRPILKIPAQMLNPITKALIDGIAKTSNLNKKELDKKIDELIDEEDTSSQDADSVKLDTKNVDSNKGYSKKEIEKMNRLIDVVK